MRAEWDNLSFLYTETEAVVNMPGWFTQAKQSVTVKSEHLNKLICSVALEKNKVAIDLCFETIYSTGPIHSVSGQSPSSDQTDKGSFVSGLDQVVRSSVTEDRARSNRVVWGGILRMKCRIGGFPFGKCALFPQLQMFQCSILVTVVKPNFMAVKTS